MGNNPREKSIYISGFTIGAGTGIISMSLMLIFPFTEEYNPVVIGTLGLILGFIFVLLSFVYRKGISK